MKSIEELNALMAELGIQPKRSLGQNFLVNPAVIEKIIDAVTYLQPKSLIEIGPGLGAITDDLRRLQVPLHLIELDTVFSNYWREQGIELTEQDALHYDWSSVPIETVLVSNLPYQISASLVIDRSMDETLLNGMVLMFQKEVAQRIAAKVGDSDYGFLSVIAQSAWKVERVVDAHPKSFLPPPKIASRVLQFKPIERNFDPKGLLKFVKTAFTQPRKRLIKNLQGMFPKDHQLLTEVIPEIHGENIRPGQLSSTQFIELLNRV